MWIGSDKELNEWLPQSAIGMSSNKINFTVEKYYKCNVYVHQAKIQPGICKDDLCDPKLMVMTNGTFERTKVTFHETANVNKCLTIKLTIFVCTLGH